jgi:DNA-binding MarR family transcriptional regulator
MTTHDLTATQATTFARYQRMRSRLSGRLGRDLAQATGLSEADFEILNALAGSPDEPVRALALRCGLEWEKSRLSHQLRRMEERGLVVRHQCTEDNRGSVVRITPSGLALAAEARRAWDEAVHRYVCAALTPEQLAALDDIAGAILARLDAPDTF